jgi:hypothetical protein
LRIFGWEIRRPPEDKLPSFTPPVQDDGAITVAAGGSYGTYIDLAGSVRSEAELVTRYRQMIQHPEVDSAVNQIANEAIVQEEDQDIVDIVLDDLPELNEKIKTIIVDEFKQCLELLKWNTHAKDIFWRWYVDGRLYFHAIIDEKRILEGLQELRYIDPRKIRKVREVTPKVEPAAQRVPGSDMITSIKKEYFVFNPSGFLSNNNPTYHYSAPATGLRIAKDAIVHVPSGLTDPTSHLVISHLHSAIKYLNQFRALEDASIIYRLSRAPERRIFYVDTGNLPGKKAEQYVRNLMTTYKNKLVYDSITGEVKDDRKVQTITEDYWLPRREGGKGTEIDTLPAGNAQGILEELEFFKQRLYQALKVPYSRTNPDAIFQGSGSAEISRDEITFSKFIDTIRLRFNILFLSILEKQLILKKIITPEEWPLIANRIKFKYARDNMFAELKEREIVNGRAATLQLLSPYVGRYYSNEWIMKNVCKFTEDDITEMMRQIMNEMQNPLFQGPPGMPVGDPMEPGQPGQPPVNQDDPNYGLSAQQNPEIAKKINKPKAA